MVRGFYTMTFQNLDFTPYILRVFGIYCLNFWGIWILHLKFSEFQGIKSQHSQTLEGKIQILKR